MSERAKAKKLAAAKRKLKEYHQLKGKQEKNSVGYDNASTSSESKDNNIMLNKRKEVVETSMYRTCTDKLDFDSDAYQKESKSYSTFQEVNDIADVHLESVELIIAEKALLCTQVAKLQTTCKQNDLEIEELNTVLKSAGNRIDSLEKTITDQNSEISTLRNSLEEMRCHMDSIHKYKKQCAEQVDYIEELKLELSLGRMKVDELQAELKEKSCQVELCNIRINQISEEASVAADNRIEDLTQTKFIHEQQIRDLQISEEASVAADNRIEDLTQTKFIHEQQIRDLQVLVKQLNIDKDQASQEYQNYAQYLNKEISIIKEKNAELMNEKSKLLDREKTMVVHIAQLEKQIQDNIARQEFLKSNGNEVNVELEMNNSALKQEIECLQQQCDNLDVTIKLQDRKIRDLNLEVEEKQLRIENLGRLDDQLKQLQPDSSKLLATLESDKVAASRAVAQNEELKKQLEEMQFKLIQVTNEKVELVELLQSEQHANKEVRFNFEKMREDLKQITEKLHFKDEEMIRLTHESNELNKIILKLNQQVDRLTHYEANEYMQKYVEPIESNNNNKHAYEDCLHSHSNAREEGPKHEDGFMENAIEALETNSMSSYSNQNSCSKSDRKMSTELPTGEAMIKLQERFKMLISEVADLTDEKQRLEHLVLQLQGETETIGEYITLYQTQRRMLKQKEIEKNTHLQRLLFEREEMKEKIIELTQLITGLEVKTENAKTMVIQEKIHSIITGIKEKDPVQSSSAGGVDHCACCSGKFETI